MAHFTRKIAVLCASAALALPALAPVYQVTPFASSKELKCLVDNVYHEARGEPFEGQVAVARVTLNRAAKASICATVYASKQFSWTWQIRYPRVRDLQAYSTAYHAAHAALNYRLDATHYHATYVKPYWAKHFTKVKQIGKHKFYK